MLGRLLAGGPSPDAQRQVLVAAPTLIGLLHGGLLVLVLLVLTGKQVEQHRPVGGGDAVAVAAGEVDQLGVGLALQRSHQPVGVLGDLGHSGGGLGGIGHHQAERMPLELELGVHLEQPLVFHGAEPDVAIGVDEQGRSTLRSLGQHDVVVGAGPDVEAVEQDGRAHAGPPVLHQGEHVRRLHLALEPQLHGRPQLDERAGSELGGLAGLDAIDLGAVGAAEVFDPQRPVAAPE